MVIKSDKYLCIYRYEDSNDTFEMESSSFNWLKKRVSELSDCGKKVHYKIVAILEEGTEEPVDFDELYAE